MAKRRKYAVKKLPAGRAHGAEGQTISAYARGSRSAVFHDTESPPDEDLHGMVAMWRAVFAQAIMDAKSRRSKKEYEHHRRDALEWLLNDRRDFTFVCDLAGYEPDCIRRQVRSAQQRGFIWRAGDGQQPTRNERPKHWQRSNLQDLGIIEKKRRGKGAQHRRGFVTRHVQLELF